MKTIKITLIIMLSVMLVLATVLTSFAQVDTGTDTTDDDTNLLTTDNDTVTYYESDGTMYINASSVDDINNGLDASSDTCQIADITILDTFEKPSQYDDEVMLTSFTSTSITRLNFHGGDPDISREFGLFIDSASALMEIYWEDLKLNSSSFIKLEDSTVFNINGASEIGGYLMAYKDFTVAYDSTGANDYGYAYFTYYGYSSGKTYLYNHISGTLTLEPEAIVIFKDYLEVEKVELQGNSQLYAGVISNDSLHTDAIDNGTEFSIIKDGNDYPTIYFDSSSQPKMDTYLYENYQLCPLVIKLTAEDVYDDSILVADEINIVNQSTGEIYSLEQCSLEQYGDDFPVDDSLSNAIATYLPEGDYYLEVEKDSETYTSSFTLDENGLRKTIDITINQPIEFTTWDEFLGWDIESGQILDISALPTGTDLNVLTIPDDVTDLTIIGTGVVSQNLRIETSDDRTSALRLTVEDLFLNCDEGSVLDIAKNNADNTLTFKGINSLITQDSLCAAIRVSDLTYLQDDFSTTYLGTLTLTGDYTTDTVPSITVKSATGQSSGAAIGGNAYELGGNITIDGGEYFCNSNEGAAIGGGSDYGSGGEITILDGSITAYSTYGAPIGGGKSSDSGNIHLLGGNINLISNSEESVAYVGYASDYPQSGYPDTSRDSSGSIDLSVCNIRSFNNSISTSADFHAETVTNDVSTVKMVFTDTDGNRLDNYPIVVTNTLTNEEYNLTTWSNDTQGSSTSGGTIYTYLPQGTYTVSSGVDSSLSVTSTNSHVVNGVFTSTGADMSAVGDLLYVIDTESSSLRTSTSSLFNSSAISEVFEYSISNTETASKTIPAAEYLSKYFSVHSEPLHGEFTMTGDTISYTPEEGFIGTDSVIITGKTALTDTLTIFVLKFEVYGEGVYEDYYTGTSLSGYFPEDYTISVETAVDEYSNINTLMASNLIQGHISNAVNITATDSNGNTLTGLDVYLPATFTNITSLNQLVSCESNSISILSNEIVSLNGIDYLTTPLTDSSTYAIIADYAIGEAPVITSGENSTYVQGSNEDLTFTSDADIEDFMRVEIGFNGGGFETLTEGVHYEKTSGSTIITLYNSYLETLTEGEYEIRIVSTTGTASASFDIASSNSSGTASGSTSTDSSGNVISATGVNTGDTLPLNILYLTSLISILGVLGIYVLRRKTHTYKE